jgi:hypothetical protein
MDDGDWVQIQHDLREAAGCRSAWSRSVRGWWWFRAPWDKDKDRPSVLDAERLMRRHWAEIQRLLSE